MKISKRTFDLNPGEAPEYFKSYGGTRSGYYFKTDRNAVSGPWKTLAAAESAQNGDYETAHALERTVRSRSAFR